MGEQVASVFSLACLVSVVGSFAPSISAPPTTSLLPTTTTAAAPQPAFLGRHNVTVSVHAGDTATLACHIIRLGDKTVSWAKRQGNNFHILTVGYQTYHNDNRYTVRYENPNNWKLQVRYAQKRDEGLYECQISTHPPMIMRVYLSVVVPKMEIRDPRGEVVSESFYRMDSTVGLQCVVVPAPPSRPVLWSRGGHPVVTQPKRGIRVDTSQMGSGVSSWLHIARASVLDTGNYTCTAGDHITAAVTVNILDGESSAAMQHSITEGGTASSSRPLTTLLLLLIFTHVLL